MSKTLKIIKEYYDLKLVYCEEENLLHVKVKPNTDFEYDLSKKIMQDVQDIVGERRHKAIIEMGEYNSSSDGSSKIYTENEYIKKYRLADAFIVKSLSVRLIVNFYITVCKPSIPTKAFRDLEKAKVWLRSINTERFYTLE